MNACGADPRRSRRSRGPNTSLADHFLIMAVEYSNSLIYIYRFLATLLSPRYSADSARVYVLSDHAGMEVAGRMGWPYIIRTFLKKMGSVKKAQSWTSQVDISVGWNQIRRGRHSKKRGAHKGVGAGRGRPFRRTLPRTLPRRGRGGKRGGLVRRERQID